MDVEGHDAWRGRVSPRWVLIHMIEEYAWHNGHADLLRACIDGREACEPAHLRHREHAGGDVRLPHSGQRPCPLPLIGRGRGRASLPRSRPDH
ncbi:mycothiol transferase [Nonomuraea helvata]|uniref:DUF664 domain-containing protein n=1 Tax=Nonomuraea helvata TaxID=37484 RepID=A0ABV5SCX1_9ACTN